MIPKICLLCNSLLNLCTCRKCEIPLNETVTLSVTHRLIIIQIFYFLTYILCFNCFDRISYHCYSTYFHVSMLRYGSL